MLSVASLLPMAIPSYVLATVTREVMAPEGVLGSLLGREEAFSGLVPAFIVLTISCTPYVQLIVGAAMRRIPAAELEAAQTLGAGPWRCFKEIIAPRLPYSLALSGLVVVLYVLSDFGAVAVLNCEVLTWELYRAHGSRDGVILAFAVLACAAPLIASVQWLRAEPSASLGYARSVRTRTTLRRGGLGVAGLAAFIMVGWGLLLPCVTLVYWLIRGLSVEVEFISLYDAVAWTGLYSLLGATATLGLILWPAWRATRPGSRVARLINQAVHLTSSLPAVVVGVGLLELIMLLRGPSGQGSLVSFERLGVWLIIGYMVRYMALAHDALVPTMATMNPRVSDAARSLGASRWRRFWRVEVPQFAPGLWAAWTLVFIAITKELPLTLLLAPLGHHTLAYRLYDAQQEGALANVGLAGIVLVTLSVTVVSLAQLRQRNGGHHAA